MKNEEILSDIPGCSDWTEITPITKGWSFDTKFRVKDASDNLYIIRISKSSDYQIKHQEFERIKQIPFDQINASRPVAFGLSRSKNFVYSIYTWIKGDDAEKIIPQLTKDEQYQYGRTAGEILRKIHSIAAPKNQSLWGARFQAKINRGIHAYHEIDMKLDDDQDILHFLRNNQHLLEHRPQTLQHGDFHLGNMVIDHQTNRNMDHNLGVIDFNRSDYGDPWEEFERSVFTVRYSVPFMNGQIHSYFQDNIPDSFFPLMALYVAYSSIASVGWGMQFSVEETQNLISIANDVTQTYNGYHTVIPTWYVEPD